MHIGVANLDEPGGNIAQKWLFVANEADRNKGMIVSVPNGEGTMKTWLTCIYSR